MKCTSCGYENLDGAESCSGCKQSFGSEASVEQKTSGYPLASPTEQSSSYVAAPVAQPAVPSSSYAAPAQRSAPAASVPPATSAYTAPPSYNTAPARPPPYSYQQPYYYPPMSQRQKQPFTITDAYIIIGFVLAIVGIFYYAYILLPAGIGFSVGGFVKRTNTRTLGLSIAGIVVGVVASLIKVGMVLSELGVIPDWLSAGIF